MENVVRWSLAGIPRLARGHRRQSAEQNFPGLVDGNDRPTEIFRLVVSKETDISLRTYLARLGFRKGALSKFVEEEVRWRVLDRTVEEAKSANTNVKPGELETAIQEAVEAVRAERFSRHARRP